MLARLAALATVFLLAIGIASCASEAPTPGPTPMPGPGTFPVTITDDAGRSVTIQKAPERIVSLSASNTELVYAAGLQDALVGVDDYSDYPPEAKDKEKVGGFSDPNYEKIISLAPDLVLAAGIHVKSAVPELERLGLTVVVFQPPTLDDVPANLRALGMITGKPDAAEAVAADIEARVEAVIAKTSGVSNKPKVFLELSPDLITVGPGTFLDDMIAKAGGLNIAASAQTAWPKLSPETVVSESPDLILLADMGSDAAGVTVEMVESRPGWEAIAAVQNDKVVPLPDRDLTDRPGPRAIEGLEYLARTFHPDLFEGTD